jgi:hypothetical protein
MGSEYLEDPTDLNWEYGGQSWDSEIFRGESSNFATDEWIHNYLEDHPTDPS